MPKFFGIAPGQERSAKGIRVKISPDGENVWMHGKWLGLGPTHAVAWITKKAVFSRPDGKIMRLGDFPAWVVRGGSKARPVVAAMFEFSQFEGGKITIL
jgi:hypothetical protein